jgi:hypothetical protein
VLSDFRRQKLMIYQLRLTPLTLTFKSGSVQLFLDQLPILAKLEAPEDEEPSD